jgi:hypothetical protein
VSRQKRWGRWDIVCWTVKGGTPCARCEIAQVTCCQEEEVAGRATHTALCQAAHAGVMSPLSCAIGRPAPGGLLKRQPACACLPARWPRTACVSGHGAGGGHAEWMDYLRLVDT